MRPLPPGLYALLLFLVPVQASALEARMRVSLEGEAPYWVGQRIAVSVDILSTGFSFSQQRFDLPEVPGVILLRPGSAGQNLVETIDGESWQGLRYRLSLLVLSPGEVEIPPFTVSFQVAAGYGSEPESFSFDSEPLMLTVRQPPGTEGLEGLLTTPELRVEGQWEPGSEALQVGDALSLTLRRVAEDVPGAAIPPLELQLPAGLQAYPESPEITDRSNRGSLTGERVERISVILQAPGDYQLPAMGFPWFDPDNETLHEAEIPALEFSVAPDPDAPADGDSGTPTPMETRRSRQALAVAALVLVLLAVGSWWGLPRVTALWRERRSRWRASEAGSVSLAAALSAPCWPGWRARRPIPRRWWRPIRRWGVRWPICKKRCSGAPAGRAANSPLPCKPVAGAGSAGSASARRCHP